MAKKTTYTIERVFLGKMESEELIKKIIVCRLRKEKNCFCTYDGSKMIVQ